jgi:hypothetical protein
LYKYNPKTYHVYNNLSFLLFDLFILFYDGGIDHVYEFADVKFDFPNSFDLLFMLLPLGVDNLLQSFNFTLHFFVLSNGLSDIFEREYVSHINSFLICLLISAMTVGSSSSIVRSVSRLGNHRRRFIINEC